MSNTISVHVQFINFDEKIRVDLGFQVKASLILEDKIIVALDS